jgi:hypothetical protein
MFIKSKHSGWLSDGTRTPFIFKSIGKTLAKIDPSKSISNAAAKIDPGPAIGKGLAEVDKFVNREIPGGWITVGAVTAGGLAIAYAPQVMALSAQTGMAPAAASNALGLPGVVASGAAAGTPVMGSTAAGLGSLGWTAPTIGGAASGAGTVGSLSAALPVAGAGGFGSLSAAIPAGTMVGNGLTGTVIGKTYLAAAPGQFAVNALGNAIPASSVGIGGIAPSSGIGASDVLKGVNRAQKLAKALTGGENVTPTQQQFAQFQSMNQAPQEQFGGLYRMNQNPFAQTQQPTSLQAPMGKTPDFLSQLSEESKTQPTLADLLRNA